MTFVVSEIARGENSSLLPFLPMSKQTFPNSKKTTIDASGRNASVGYHNCAQKMWSKLPTEPESGEASPKSNQIKSIPKNRQRMRGLRLSVSFNQSQARRSVAS